MPRQETRRLGRNQPRLRAGQHGFRLIKRQADLLELVIALVKAGNHVLAEHGVIIADDPDLDLNSHGHSEGSMADKLQPTCLPQRWPRHPTDFYALVVLGHPAIAPVQLGIVARRRVTSATSAA